MTIEKARAEDAREMAIIVRTAWQTAYAGLLPDGYLKNLLTPKELDKLERFFFNCITKCWNESYVMTDEGGHCGVITFSASRDEGDNGGELVGIYILAERRCRGYGRQSVEFAESVLRERFSSVSLWVLEGNDKAIGFYERMGFCLTGEKREVELGVKCNELKMAKML